MKSNRQRRAEIKAKRSKARLERIKNDKRHNIASGRWLPVDSSKLNLGNTYGCPPDYYRDVEFDCVDCGAEELWTAKQQKWWYEEAGGYFFTTAIRCRECRKKERERKEAARQAHQEGLLKKQDKET